MKGIVSKKEDLIYFFKKNKFKRIFLICGNNSFKNSGAKKFFSSILKNLIVKYYFKKSFFPEIRELKIIIKQIKKYKPDLILAIGGGSIIDYAKISNLIEIKDNLEQLIKNYSYPYKKKNTKLLVIPTTAGSGAEATSNAVIYINKTKYSFENELLIPDYFFLIPEFIVNANFNVKASAGFDSIAQSIESLISKKSNQTSVEFAIKSLKISINSFDNFLKNPNLKNAGKMSVAANLAGNAINISKTTGPHALSYPFTSFYGISHGHAVSLFFESFLKYNFSNLNKSTTKFDLSKRFKILFKLFNAKNINDFTHKISNIKKEAKLIDDFNLLNINTVKNSKKIIKEVNMLRLSNNPIKIDENILLDIILKKK